MAFRSLLVLITLGLWVALADAGQPAGSLGSHDVIIGTVTQVSDEEATNGNPAKVTVEITESLKGQLKGTVVVIWSGSDHGVDYGDPAKNPIVIKWAAAKAEKPDIGNAYILFGRLSNQKDKDGRELQWLYTSPDGRMPFNAENRTKAIATIKFFDELRKAEMDRQAAAIARHAAQVKQWRAGMTNSKLAAAIQDADFVAIGKVSSYMIPDNVYVFTVAEVLKGRRRKSYSNDSYYVELVVTKEVAAVLDRESEYVLLLSENGLTVHPSVLAYQPIGDGVVLADAVTMKLARESTKDLADKVPPAVLLYPDDAVLARALATAADRKLTVIRGSGIGDSLPMDKIVEVSGIKAEFYLRASRYTEYKSTKLKLELARSDATKTLLINTTLTDPDDKSLAAHAAEIVATILKAK